MERIKVTISADEFHALVAIAEEDLRSCPDVLRWLLQQEIKRRKPPVPQDIRRQFPGSAPFPNVNPLPVNQ